MPLKVDKSKDLKAHVNKNKATVQEFGGVSAGTILVRKRISIWFKGMAAEE